jgi:3-hydroxyisobutyrate dehydrogenase
MHIGFLGLGHMGAPMARNLLKAGHRLTVFDPVPASVASLVEAGARPPTRRAAWRRRTSN